MGAVCQALHGLPSVEGGWAGPAGLPQAVASAIPSAAPEDLASGLTSAERRVLCLTNSSVPMDRVGIPDAAAARTTPMGQIWASLDGSGLRGDGDMAISAHRYWQRVRGAEIRI